MTYLGSLVYEYATNFRFEDFIQAVISADSQNNGEVTAAIQRRRDTLIKIGNHFEDVVKQHGITILVDYDDLEDSVEQLQMTE